VSEPVRLLQSLCRRAGALAVAARGDLAPERKPDRSLVTLVDRAVEELFRREISAGFPGDGFYGEETGGEPLAHSRLWIVDPIDGTTNMVTGLPIWGVSAALIVDGEPAAGVFHMPCVDETFWFERGGGAYLNGVRLKSVDTGPLDQEDPVCIGSEAVLALDLSGFFCRQRNFGSLVSHYCWAASGAVRASVSVRDRLHDLAAGYGIAREAGCAVEFLEGDPAPFRHFLENPLNLRPLLVGHPQTLERLRQVLRERPSGLETLN
jgi:fructose-1,6-bisphosphatase/inositol monophosphatase family enzyme